MIISAGLMAYHNSTVPPSVESELSTIELTFVGLPVGLNDGLSLGEREGMSEGVADGRAVGLTLGF